MTSAKSFNHDQDSKPWTDLIAAHLEGDQDGTEALAVVLEVELRRATSSFLGYDDPDVGDVVGESILAVLDYLLRRGEFQGDLGRFAVTVAINRCRNLLAWRQRQKLVPLEPLAAWIANDEASPLDLLLADEQQDLLQQALGGVGPACEKLLRAHYLEGKTIEAIRSDLGLESVQVVYYRRGICLKKAFRFLNRRLGGCSQGGRTKDNPRPHGGGDSCD